MSTGLTQLKDGLVFDIFDSEGLNKAVQHLGSSFAIVGIEEATNGFIPDIFDGIGIWINEGKIYKDYIITLPDIGNNSLSLISNILGCLLNQSSILLVDEGKPSLVDCIPISVSENTLDYLFSELSIIKPNFVKYIKDRLVNTNSENTSIILEEIKSEIS